MGFVAEGIVVGSIDAHPKLNKFIGKHGVGVWQYLFLNNAYPDKTFPRTSANTKKFDDLTRNGKDSRVTRIAIGNVPINKVAKYYKEISAGKASCTRDSWWRIEERVRKERVSVPVAIVNRVVNCEFTSDMNTWTERRQLKHVIPSLSSEQSREQLTNFLIKSKEVFADQPYFLDTIKSNDWKYSLYNSFVRESLRNLNKEDLLFFIDAFPTNITEALTTRMESKWG